MEKGGLLGKIDTVSNLQKLYSNVCAGERMLLLKEKPRNPIFCLLCLNRCHLNAILGFEFTRKDSHSSRKTPIISNELRNSALSQEGPEYIASTGWHHRKHQFLLIK